MATDLPSLRRAVSGEGLGWEPGETPHTGLSLLQARARLGADPPGGRPALQRREAQARARPDDDDGARSASAAAPPARFDWRDVSGADYVSAVKDQAGCGSCVAFGATAVLESMVRITARQPTLPVDLSEAYVFFCHGPRHGAGRCPDGGWWPDDAFEAMKRGVVDELNYPYTDADQPCRRGSDWESRLTTYASWTTRTTRSAIKTYLSTVGPMAACFTVYEDFFSFYTGGVWRYSEATAGEIIGGHCVMIVGYDDAQRCWIAKNSWGTGWGERGYFRMAYGSAGLDAEMWGIDGPVRSPLIRSTLRVVAGGAGQAWHTLRRGDGRWRTAVERLDTPATGDPGTITAVSAAATVNRLHVVGLVAGQAWYTRQRTGAGWATWKKPGSTVPTGAGAWASVSCATSGDTLHVAARSGGSVWHTRRSADGTWQPTWSRVTPASGGPGAFTGAVCVVVRGRTTVVGVAGGRLWLMARLRGGSWTAPTAITPAGTPPGPVGSVSAAAVDGRLHLVVLVGGRPFHLERSATGGWSGFRALPSASPTAPATFTAVSCADVGRTLQVVAVSGGRLWHRLRQADGTWTASFGDVGGQITGEPAALVSVDCA